METKALQEISFFLTKPEDLSRRPLPGQFLHLASKNKIWCCKPVWDIDWMIVNWLNDWMIDKLLIVFLDDKLIDIR